MIHSFTNSTCAKLLRVLTLYEPTPPNNQTHSNNSSETADELDSFQNQVVLSSILEYHHFHFNKCYFSFTGFFVLYSIHGLYNTSIDISTCLICIQRVVFFKGRNIIWERSNITGGRSGDAFILMMLYLTVIHH